MRRCSMLVILILGVLGRTSVAQWSEPKDGLLTEKQLTTYLDMSKQWIANMKAAGKSVDGSPMGFAAFAIYTERSPKFKDALKQSGLQEAEFTWIGSKTWEAWSAIDADHMLKQADADTNAQLKKNADRLAEDQSMLAECQKAQADGGRLLTPDERAAASKQAETDKQTAAEEVNQHALEAKNAAADAAKSDAEAKADDASANSPPSDLNDDEKAAFAEAKKNEAQAARDSAQEDRMKESDAKQAQAEAEARVTAAIAAIRQPGIPHTPEEKAEVAKQNAEAVAALQADIGATRDALKLLNDTGQNTRKELMERRTRVPAANVELLAKHLQDFANVWGVKPPVDSK